MYLPAGISICPTCRCKLQMASGTEYYCAGCERTYEIDHCLVDKYLLSWVTDNLAVGTLAQAQNVDLLVREKVDALMSCRRDQPKPAFDFRDRCAFFPIEDAHGIPDGYLDAATNWLIHRLDRKERVLVYCAAGQSRSVTVAAVTMVKLGHAQTFDNAVEIIRDVRWQARPHPALRSSAREYLREGA